MESISYTAKMLRRSVRRLQARVRFGALTNAPILFANSFPKSGTHLLTQVLEGLTGLGPAVNSGLPALTMFAGESGQAWPLAVLLARLDRLRPGDIAYGHLHAVPEITARLTHPRNATFFIYRDPRDVVVSHVHYVTEMEPNHVHHDYYARQLKNFDERLKTSILGRPELTIPFPDVGARFAPYLGWLDHPEVLLLKFEDFITQRAAALEKVLDFVEGRGFRVRTSRQQALEALESAIHPQKSPTFRSGKIGKWREVFSEEHKSLFKTVSGDLLIRLGYETSDAW